MTLKQQLSLAEKASVLRLALVAVALTVAMPVHCQVIEIGDDGATRLFTGPTRFIDGGGLADPQPAVVTVYDGADPFDRAARAEDIDAKLLRSVAWAESRGEMDAVSPKGAVGIMQLMPATAAELGVDPRDRDANIFGGARYLARLISRFQSVPLALAAYNAGPGAVLRWGGIPPYAETQTYVTSILSRWHGSLYPATREVVTVPRTAGVDVMLIEVP